MCWSEKIQRDVHKTKDNYRTKVGEHHMLDHTLPASLKYLSNVISPCMPLRVTLVSYFGSTLAILAVKFVKPLNALLLQGKTRSSSIESPLKLLYSLTVPKSYFSHFYWSLTIYCILIEIFPFTISSKVSATQTKNIKIIQALLLVQGLRRSVESYYVTKFLPKSKINVMHYIVGMGHYALVSAITWFSLNSSYTYQELFQKVTFVDILLCIGFGICSVNQWSNHHHLANLKKYSLPDFKYVALPHYTNEIQLYAILFIISIKDGQFGLIQCNYLACLLFVAINLSITSIESYTWYKGKFEDFKLKWAVIPGVL